MMQLKTENRKQAPYAVDCQASCVYDLCYSVFIFVLSTDADTGWYNFVISKQTTRFLFL